MHFLGMNKVVQRVNKLLASLSEVFEKNEFTQKEWDTIKI